MPLKFVICALLSVALLGDGFSPRCTSSSRNKVVNIHSHALENTLFRADTAMKSSVSPIPSTTDDHLIVGSTQSLGKIKSMVVRSLMISFIISMCVALPVTLFPVHLLHKFKVINRVQKEKMSLQVGQLCSRFLMRLFPFSKRRVVVDRDDVNFQNPGVCARCGIYCRIEQHFHTSHIIYSRTIYLGMQSY